MNILYDHTYEPDSDNYKDLHANVINSERSTFGNTKYSIALIDDFSGKPTILNKILVDCGLATDKPQEKLEDVTLPELPIDEGIEEEVDERKVVPSIEVNADDFKGETSLALLEELNIEDVAKSLADGAGKDLYFGDFNAFMEDLCKKVRYDDNRNETAEVVTKEPSFVPMKAVAPVNYKTPNVLWHQTNKVVKLEISIAGIRDYTLHVLRMRNLVFR